VGRVPAQSDPVGRVTTIYKKSKKEGEENTSMLFSQRFTRRFRLLGQPETLKSQVKCLEGGVWVFSWCFLTTVFLFFFFSLFCVLVGRL
jgi:hypothetical protein